MEGKWIAIGFGVVFVAIMVWTISKAAKRRKALQQLAGELGMSFVDRIDDFSERGLGRLKMYAKGTVRAANVLQGSVGGATLSIFDYTSVRKKRNGKRSTYLKGTYSCLELHNATLPAFRIVHRSRSNRESDLQFDGQPAFHEHYSVRTGDPDAARAVIGDRLIRFLGEHGDDAWEVAADGNWLGIAKRPSVSASRHVAAADMRAYRDDVVSLFNGIAIR